MKLEQGMRQLLLDVAGVTLIALILALPVCLLLGVPYPIAIVGSSSMEPSLCVGDIVVILPVSDVNIGDIAYVQVGTKTYLHRVVDIFRVTDGVKGVVTKGDSNEITDQCMIGVPYSNSTDVKGRVLALGGTPISIPRIGAVMIQLKDLLRRFLNFADKRLALLGSLACLAAVFLLFVGLKVDLWDKLGLRGVRPKLDALSRLSVPPIVLLFPVFVAALCVVNYVNSTFIPVRVVFDPSRSGIMVGGGRVLRSGQCWTDQIKVTNNGSFPTLAIVGLRDPRLRAVCCCNCSVARLLKGETCCVCFSVTAPQVSQPTEILTEVMVMNVPLCWFMPGLADCVLCSVDPLLGFVIANGFVALLLYVPFLVAYLLLPKARSNRGGGLGGD